MTDQGNSITSLKLLHMNYQEKKFELPTLVDLSPESITGHLALYSGYVKNFNALMAAQEELLKDSEKNALALSEIVRRLSFEFDGMRMHEYYFSQWERGAQPITTGSALAEAINRQYGSFESFIGRVRGVALMRGVGWSVVYWDTQFGCFHIGWVSEQHQGHFATLPVILALDVWEHAFVAQYGTTGKAPYIDAFFKNLNWAVLEERFDKCANRRE